MKFSDIETKYFSGFDWIISKCPRVLSVPLCILWLIPLVIASFGSMIWFIISLALGEFK